MRVYSIQDFGFVIKWLECFHKGICTVDNNVLGTNEDTLDLLNKKDIYGGKDFIYTFYNSIWQSNPKEFLRKNNDLYGLIDSFTGNAYMNNLCLIELEVPDNVGILGVIGRDYSCEQIVCKEVADKTNNNYEYVIPYVKKEWVLEIYNLSSIIIEDTFISYKHGFHLVPMELTHRKDKLLDRPLSVVDKYSLVPDYIRNEFQSWLNNYGETSLF